MKPTTVRGKQVYEVQWIGESACDGCCFATINVECINNSDQRCDDGNAMEGKIYIARTKKAVAEYVLQRMGGNDE